MNPNSVLLRDILGQLPGAHISAVMPEVAITGIAIDSRAVKPGDLFVCLTGGRLDGHDFAQQAISSGATAIVSERSMAGLGVPYVQIASTRQALTWIAAAFYGWPARKLTVIGITGTDGKTTTAMLIHQILLAAGLKAGLISTVNAMIGDQSVDTGFHVTTPDAHDVQRYLDRMVRAGMTHAVLETTSHGWAQHRVDACEFDIGVLTNITHEHLDEHGSYENYRAAKARLFLSLEQTLPKVAGNPRLAVLNRDDGSYEYLKEITRVKQLSYGLHSDADLRATDVRVDESGISFAAEFADLRVGIESGLQGEYNVSNCLAAIGATVIGAGVSPDKASRGVAALKGVPGRMERIEMGQDFTAIVDFAHTPNALRVTLEAARKKVQRGGRIIVVFGSAGLRDRAKRRLMAETAADLADLSVFTAEDPRTESLEAILLEMADGARTRGGREGETFFRIPDRGEAIRFAVKAAKARDVVLACGKGHEQSMCFGTTEYAWDDRTAMQAALAELLGITAPEMPYLPTRDSAEAAWLK